MTEAPGPATHPLSRRRLMWTTLVAIAVAVLLLLAVVLPAEFGVDPLGTGRMLGLSDMSAWDAHTEQPQAFTVDEVSFVLSPFQSVEYKYALAGGAGLIYSWRASGSVVYDLHAEPDPAEGFAPDAEASFDEGRGDGRHGIYIAPFGGIHGWFWENRGADDVTVTLRAATVADTAIEFSGGRQIPRSLGSH